MSNGITGNGEFVLSVAVVAGAQRPRMQRLLDALAAQTIAAEVEVVVVDTKPSANALTLPSVPSVTVLTGDSRSYGEARAMAVREARSDIVAFLEDHCYPHPQWAEAVAAAYQNGWSAVGYTIAHANPRTRSSRIVHLATYGEWQAPPEGPATALPGNNVSYRRGALLGLGVELPAMLQADFNIHARFRRNGLTLATEPNARTEHESEESLFNGFRSSFVYSRVLAANAASLEGWTAKQRLTAAVGMVGAAALSRLVRLVRALRGHPRELARLAGYLPVILAIYMVSAVGGALGYLTGEGSAAEAYIYLEVDAPRAA